MIQNDKIKALINAGINTKKKDPKADLTPTAYMRLAKYIELLEKLVEEAGKPLPPVV
jgi:hypothetical protein